MTANNQLTIASPPAAGTGAGAATGWYAYIGTGGSDPGDAARYRQQPVGAPTPIGTNLVVTAFTTAGATVPSFNTAGAATTRATARGNTLGSAVATHGCRWHRLGNAFGSGGQFMVGNYDDVVWFNDVIQSANRPNNNFLGDLRVVGSLPIGSGSHRDFVAGGTAPYNGVAAATTAPGVAVPGTGGTVPVGAYLVGYTWVDQYAETTPSATSQATTTTHASVITTTPPALPTNATGYHVYISQAGGGPLTRQTTTPQTGANWTLTAAPTTGGAAPPVANTTYPNYQQVNKTPV